MIEFLHLLCRKKKFFCVGVTLFHECILLKTSSLVEFVKWLFKNINKTHSQNRRNLNTVKPVHSGHLRLLKRVSAIITCLLYIEFLAFWAKNTAEIKIDVFLIPYE